MFPASAAAGKWFFPLSSLEEERDGVRRPMFGKEMPLTPTLSPFQRGEGAE
jgi:hypothetical protein